MEVQSPRRRRPNLASIDGEPFDGAFQTATLLARVDPIGPTFAKTDLKISTEIFPGLIRGSSFEESRHEQIFGVCAIIRNARRT
jgi:hypothetical protein